jgi:hypothetical protein
MARSARRIGELGGAAGREQEVERAALLLGLGRHDDARSAYLAVVERFPDDARGYAGLARHAVAAQLDFPGAAKILASAPKDLVHADRHVHEIRIGVRATNLFYEVLPRVAAGGIDAIVATVQAELAQMRPDILALEALGDDRGMVLHLVADLVDEVIPLAMKGDTAAMLRKARKLLPRALELRTRMPESRYAAHVVIQAAVLSDDSAAAFAALAEPLPKDAPAWLVERRAQAMFELVATFGARDQLDALDELVTAATRDRTDTRAARTRAEVAALRARLRGDRAAWPKIAEDYAALVPTVPTKDDASLLSNLAVAQLERGERARAIDLWRRAVAVGDSEAEVARYDLAVATGDGTALEALVGTAGDEVKLLALGWLATNASDAGARKKHARRLARERKRAEATSVRARVLPGDAGVILRGAFQIGVGYSSAEGLQVALELWSTPWLVVPG